jgi:hypothetical protein
MPKIKVNIGCINKIHKTLDWQVKMHTIAYLQFTDKELKKNICKWSVNCYRPIPLYFLAKKILANRGDVCRFPFIFSLNCRIWFYMFLLACSDS